MKSIRFDRADIEMRQAAIVLAISQEPWAESVRCNPMDYRGLGWHWFNYPDFKISIQKDEFGSFQQAMEQTQDALAHNVHYVIIRPDPNVPEGWMELDTDRKIR